MHDANFIERLGRLHRDGVPFCIVTLVDARGSIPQEVGATAVFGEDGLMFGTVGGGRLEARCIEKARELLTPGQTTRTVFERLNLHRDLGMTCAGEVALYYEVHGAAHRWEVVIFGAGHVGQKLCRFLTELDCHVVCVDPRQDWLDRLPRSERLEARLVGDFAEGVDAVSDGTAVAVMTMGHATDVPVLVALERKACRLSYLGVIGSDSKAAILRRHLREAGVSPSFIESIICPIGERLGDNTPAEIAVGVLSHLVKVRRQPAS